MPSSLYVAYAYFPILSSCSRADGSLRSKAEKKADPCYKSDNYKFNFYEICIKVTGFTGPMSAFTMFFVRMAHKSSGVFY